MESIIGHFFYLQLIHQWNETGVIPQGSTTPPLSMFLLGFPNRFFHYDILKGGILVNILFGLFIVLLSYLITYKVTKSLLFSFIIGLVFSTHPTFVHISCQFLRESSFFFFILLTVLLFIDFFQKRSLHYLVFSGFFTAAALLCRHETVELIVLFTFCLIYCSINKRSFIFFYFTTYYSSVIISVLIITLIIGVPLNYLRIYTLKADQSSVVKLVNSHEF